jgi:hypothetical protein
MFAFQATKDDGKRRHKGHDEDEEEINMSEIAALIVQLKIQ